MYLLFFHEAGQVGKHLIYLHQPCVHLYGQEKCKKLEHNFNTNWEENDYNVGLRLSKESQVVIFVQQTNTKYKQSYVPF